MKKFQNLLMAMEQCKGEHTSSFLLGWIMNPVLNKKWGLLGEVKEKKERYSVGKDWEIIGRKVT